ncbi:MAG TPA: hypothetical protein VI997_06530 [Candidatus Thermoplasmatota archaeon]|nr:hypothetical protein [Candidatus Thermoplasmatota archaeon]
MRPLLALLLAAAFLAAAPVRAGPVTHEACEDAATPVPFAANPRDLENLHFHEGKLFVTGADAKLHAFASDETDTVVADLGARSGAMVTGADGALHVRVGSADVWRFPGDGTHTVVATGLAGANGMAVDAAGNLYVSDEPTGRIYKLPVGSPASWTVWTRLEGPNGLVADDARGVLWTVLTTDGRSSVVALSLADASVVDEIPLTFGAFSLNVFWPFSDFSHPPVAVHGASDPTSPVLFKALDDLTLAPDGRLYVAAWMPGEILRVDPTTRAACVVASGFAQPSSVRIASGFGAFDGDLFVTDFGGHAQLVTDTPQDGHVSRVPLG